MGTSHTLQKLHLRGGQVHTTVSAEAVRFALRRRLASSESDSGTNRKWDSESQNLGQTPSARLQIRSSRDWKKENLSDFY